MSSISRPPISSFRTARSTSPCNALTALVAGVPLLDVVGDSTAPGGLALGVLPTGGAASVKGSGAGETRAITPDLCNSDKNRRNSAQVLINI